MPQTTQTSAVTPTPQKPSERAMVEWLLTPISGALGHTIAPWASWHGRLMVLSWSFLLPLGMLAARYFKVTPKQDWPRMLDNKLWWRTHL
jgi:hypothetical protein